MCPEIIDVYYYIYYEIVSGKYYLTCSEWEVGWEEEFSSYVDVISFMDNDKYYLNDKYSGCVRFEIKTDNDDEVYV